MGEEDEVYEAIGFDEPSDTVDRVAFKVIGAAIEVQRVLGAGLALLINFNVPLLKHGIRRIALTR